MPIFIAALLGGLIQAAGTLVGRVLLSLGFGYVSYTALDSSLSWIKSSATPTARKGDPINVDFEERAKRLLREAMDANGLTVAELTECLKGIGVTMSTGGVANKISRGGFSAAFFLMCMEAIGASHLDRRA